MKTKLTIGIIVALIIIPLTLLISITKNDENVIENVKEYCKENNEIQFYEVTKFDWDTAYLDYQHYGYGEEIREKYDLTGDFKLLDSDNLLRIAFCKDGELVKDVICDFSSLSFGGSTTIIKPETIFVVEWDTESNDSLMLSEYRTGD